jgi:hypothetical protein
MELQYILQEGYTAVLYLAECKEDVTYTNPLEWIQYSSTGRDWLFVLQYENVIDIKTVSKKVAII